MGLEAKQDSITSDTLAGHRQGDGRSDGSTHKEACVQKRRKPEGHLRIASWVSRSEGKEGHALLPWGGPGHTWSPEAKDSALPGHQAHLPSQSHPSLSLRRGRTGHSLGQCFPEKDFVDGCSFPELNHLTTTSEDYGEESKNTQEYPLLITNFCSVPRAQTARLSRAEQTQLRTRRQVQGSVANGAKGAEKRDPRPGGGWGGGCCSEKAPANGPV